MIIITQDGAGNSQHKKYNWILYRPIAVYMQIRDR